MPDGSNAPRDEMFPEPEMQDFALAAKLTQHLPAAMRALEAARFANIVQGMNSISLGKCGIRGVSGPELAAVFGVSEGTIRRAKQILVHGTSEDARRILAGEGGIAEIYRRIRQERNLLEITPKPKSTRRRAPRVPAVDHHQRRMINTAIWNSLRDGLYAMTSLPRVSDVLVVITGGNKVHIVDDLLPKALSFLQEFHNEYAKRSHKSRKNGKGSADAGNGESTP